MGACRLLEYGLLPNAGEWRGRYFAVQQLRFPQALGERAGADRRDAAHGGLYWTRYAERQQNESLKTRLAFEVGILRGELDAVPQDGLEAWAKAAEARAQARITIIDAAGGALADSQHDAETLENHGSLPEVADAYAGRAGTATRRAESADRELLYVTLPLTYEGRPGFVLRAGAPLDGLAEAAAAVHSSILVDSLLATAMALALAFWFSHTLTRRVLRLQDFADNLVQERTPKELTRDADDELGALAASLNRTAVRLRDFIDRLSLESARREAILTSMVEGVLAVDHEMRVMFCNPAFARAVNASAPVVERLPVLELVRDPAFLDILSRAMVTGKSVVERMQVADAGGRAYAIHAAPLTNTAGRRRHSRTARRHGPGTPGARAAGFRRQRFARTANSVDGDFGIRRDAAGRG